MEELLPAIRALALIIAVLSTITGNAQPTTTAPTSAPIPWDYNASHLLLFQEQLGMHLADGTHQKWIYNLDRLECARRCTYSGREGPDRIVCRSFEFYPFEEHRPDAPWRELPNNGICVLNSGDSSSAMLRYEDDGLTDAELLYTSHFTHRNPSSHYTAVDLARGTNPVVYEDYSNRIPWTGSRLGAVIMEVPKVKRRHFECLAQPDANNVTTIVYALNYSTTYLYRAGFAPVDTNTNKCPQKVEKEVAATICTQAGGEICTQRDLRMLFNEKLGCGIDGEDGVFPVWAFEDLLFNRSETKYVKCCTRHRPALTCESYSQENIDFCSKLTTKDQCISQGSGYNQQTKYGFGNLLYEIRRGCIRDENACGKTTFSEWNPRDRCIWCGKQCRPGSDMGICPTNNSSAQEARAKQFTDMFNVDCAPQKACGLSKTYPDLAERLVKPFEMDIRDDVTSPPTKEINCRSFKTAKECLRNYDDCFWGTWYGRQVCRSLDKLQPQRPPTKRPTKKGNKKKKATKG